MARSHQRRRDVPDDESSFERFLTGFKRSEVRRGREYTVQPVAGASAVKDYICPGCGNVVAAGTAHLVAWRADGIMGDAADLADRRHWHSHCWRMS